MSSTITNERIRVFGKAGELIFEGRAEVERFTDGRMKVTPGTGVFSVDLDVPPKGWETKPYTTNQTEGGTQ